MFSFDKTTAYGMDGNSTSIVSSDDAAAVFSHFNFPEYTLLPGFCDVHVHFREPGFSYKETISSGCAAAAAGGYTAVCTMPNLKPVPDSPEKLCEQLDIIERDATIAVYPYGAITVGEGGKTIAKLEAMAPDVIAFSDDGKGVQSDKMMLRAMTIAKELGKIIAAHCEDESLLNGGYIHDGDYAARNGHRGICSESEYRQISRDLELAAKTGCAYHVCHVSAKESIELIRQAKKTGIDVTWETGPHYLTLDDEWLREDGKWKMNPPLRSPADREALVEAMLDGTLDMIATDHAPHSEEEKSRGLQDSVFGIVGLETAFPVLYTRFVRTGMMTMDRLIELMAINPRKRFNIPLGNDFALWDLRSSWTVDPNEFRSKGRATPFEGMKVWGKCLATFYDGKVVHSDIPSPMMI